MAIFSIWLFLDRRNDKTNSRIDSHAERLVAIETKLSQYPTHDHIGAVYDEIRGMANHVNEIKTNVAGLQATLESVKELTSRMDTFWRTNPHS